MQDKNRIVAATQGVEALRRELVWTQPEWSRYFATNATDTILTLGEYCTLFPTNCPSRLDPWHREYRICLDTDRNGHIALGRLIVKTPVAVWSCGPNGVDEMGLGDDIIDWGSHEGRPRSLQQHAGGSTQ